jgi:hypothetical protein
LFEETLVFESTGFDNGNWENRYSVGGGIDKVCARIHLSLAFSALLLPRPLGRGRGKTCSGGGGWIGRGTSGIGVFLVMLTALLFLFIYFLFSLLSLLN